MLTGRVLAPPAAAVVIGLLRGDFGGARNHSVEEGQNPSHNCSHVGKRSPHVPYGKVVHLGESVEAYPQVKEARTQAVHSKHREVLAELEAPYLEVATHTGNYGAEHNLSGPIAKVPEVARLRVQDEAYTVSSESQAYRGTGHPEGDLHGYSRCSMRVFQCCLQHTSIVSSKSIGIERLRGCYRRRRNLFDAQGSRMCLFRFVLR